MKGNFLREKARGLIAQISFRFGPTFEKFCQTIIGELQSESLKSGSVDSQLKRDAIYQILSIRLCDENDIEIEPFVKLIQADLERENSYLIVKSRSVQLLAKLSSFQALHNDTTAQETLLNGGLSDMLGFARGFLKGPIKSSSQDKTFRFSNAMIYNFYRKKPSIMHTHRWFTGYYNQNRVLYP